MEGKDNAAYEEEDGTPPPAADTAESASQHESDKSKDEEATENQPLASTSDGVSLSSPDSQEGFTSKKQSNSSDDVVDPDKTDLPAAVEKPPDIKVTTSTETEKEIHADKMSHEKVEGTIIGNASSIKQTVVVIQDDNPPVEEIKSIIRDEGVSSGGTIASAQNNECAPKEAVPINKENQSSSAAKKEEIEEKNDDGKGEAGKERELWDRPVEFLLSCVAMSVGLGNFWRFPTTAYENGGGAFLIPYLCVLIFIGRPLYFLELSIGQFTSRSTVKIWNIVPAFRGIGYAQALASLCVVTYYAGIIAIAFFYLSMSFQKVLPWSVCNEEWADMETCVEVLPPDSVNASDDSIYSTSSDKVTLQISAEQYFKRFLLQEPEDLSNGIGIPDWRLTICLAITWFLVLGTLIKGVKSHGKVSYFTAIFPYVGLLTLLVQGCLLPGASEGMLYFITPRWEEILNAKVWYAAVTQSFFSLSVGFGPIMMFSSHNKFRQNVYRDAMIISLLDTFTSLLAGFTIFSVLGYLKYITKVENFDDIVSGGTALIFVSYPTAIAAFQAVPQLFSVLFFLMLITLGLGSTTALVSTPITILIDDFGHRVRPIYITVAVCVACFLLGLVFITPGGQWILDVVDFFGGGFVIYILTFIETVAIFWIYGQRKYLSDMRFMLGVKLGFYWKFCYAFFIPVGLFVIFIYFLVNFQDELPTYNGGLEFPDIAFVIGWLILTVALSMLPLHYCFAYRKTKGATVRQRILNTFRPNAKHRPRVQSDYEAWLLYTQVDVQGRDGGGRIDAWKAYALDSLKTPAKLNKFNKEFEELSQEQS